MFERINSSFSIKDSSSVVLIHGNVKEEIFLTNTSPEKFGSSHFSRFELAFWHYAATLGKKVVFFDQINNFYTYDQESFDMVYPIIKGNNKPHYEVADYLIYQKDLNTKETRKVSKSLINKMSLNNYDFIKLETKSDLLRISQEREDFKTFINHLKPLLDSSEIKDLFIYISDMKTILQHIGDPYFANNIFSEFTKLPSERGIKLFIDLESYDIKTENNPIFQGLPTLEFIFQRDSSFTNSGSKYDATIFLDTPGRDELRVFLLKFQQEAGGGLWNTEELEKLIRFMLSQNQNLKKWIELFTELKKRPAENIQEKFSLRALKALMKGYLRFGNISNDDRPPMQRLKEDFPALSEITVNIERMVHTYETRKTNPEMVEGFRMHLAFLGNPGTGKTTIARLVGEIFQEKGLLSKGHFIEAKADDFVAGYVGQTAIKTAEKCKEALGGVLFIDEAYAIAQAQSGGNSNSFGEEAIATLLQFMENHRNDLCVIMAGYTNEMRKFIKVNPGLNSRIPENNRLIFKDYSASQLSAIFKRKMEKKFQISDELMNFTEFIFEEKIRSRESNRDPRSWGNARVAEELAQELTIACIERNKDNLSSNSPLTLGLEDYRDEKYKSLKVKYKRQSFVQPGDGKKEGAKDSMEEIRNMGQPTVTEEIEKYLGFLEMAKKRGDDNSDYRPHLVLTGNPGTGKTTLARKLGRLLRERNIMSSGNFVECKREDLVAYGEDSVRDKFDEALGGVLFIDEAYALTENGDERGREIVNQLLTFMENNRTEVVVILAGYTDDMRRFVESNPGLRRRIRTELNIPDFVPEKLLEVFHKKINESRIVLSSELKNVLPSVFEYMYQFRDTTFGNAGEVEKLKNSMYENWVLRVKNKDAELKQETIDLHNEWTIDDLPEYYRNKVIQKSSKDELNAVLEKIKQIPGSEGLLHFCEELIARNEFNKVLMRSGNRIQIEPIRLVIPAGNQTVTDTVIPYLAELMMHLDIIKKFPIDQAIRAINPNQLKGEYLGQTVPKVDDFFKSSIGKIIIISGVSQLLNHSQQDSYTGEVTSAIDRNLRTLSEKVVCFLVDNESNLESFLASYPSFRSQFTVRITMPEPSAQLLTDIVTSEISKAGFRVDDEIRKKLVETAEKQMETHADLTILSDQLIKGIKKNAMLRLTEKSTKSGTINKDDLQILSEDIPQ
jgi:SpoVK/Ycf46/Vps4 family AAA+-type ATPase